MLSYLLHLVQSSAVWPAEFAVASAWQSPLLVAIAWTGMKSAPRLSPRVRFLMWLVVFFLAALLPFATLRMHPEWTTLPVHAASGMAAAHVGVDWAVLLAGMWFLSSLFFLLRLLANAFELRRVVKSSTELAPEAMDAELRSILCLDKTPANSFVLDVPGLSAPNGWLRVTPRRFAISRPVTLRLSREIDSPVAIGFFRPAVLLPEWLAKKLTLSEMKQVVLHEMAHLKRGDDWTNLLQKLVRAVFPLNPALLWTDRHLSSEREMACDDAVLERAISPREYALCLTNLAEKRMLRHLQSLAPGAWRRRSELASRVNRILNPGSRLSTGNPRPVVVVLLSALFCAGLVLTHSPNMVTFVRPSAQNVAPGILSASDLQGTAFSQAHYQQASFTVPASAPSAFSARQTVMPRTVDPISHRRVLRHKRIVSSIQPEHPASHKPHLRLLKAGFDPLYGSRYAGRFDSRAAWQEPAVLNGPGFVLAIWEIGGQTPLLIHSGSSDLPAFPATGAGSWIVIQL